MRLPFGSGSVRARDVVKTSSGKTKTKTKMHALRVNIYSDHHHHQHNIIMFIVKNYLINVHHHRLRHVYVTNYSTNYRHHLMFKAKLLGKLSSLNKSCDANVSTKQHCISQTPSRTTVMRALWGRMKMPPWLKILSTRVEVAGTQYIELTK